MKTYSMSSVSLLVVAVAALALSKCIFANEYVVGENSMCTSPHLWNPSSSCDYNSWAGNHNFLVGDSLVFYYNDVDSNVAKVTESDYEACKVGHTNTSASNSVTIFSTSSPTKFILESTSTFYFISTINCTSQHLSLTVTSSSSSSSHRALQDLSAMEPSSGPSSEPSSDPNSEVLPADGGTTEPTNSEPSDSNPTPSPHSKHILEKSILGSVGGLVLLGAKLWLIRYCVHKRRNKKKKDAEKGVDSPSKKGSASGHNNGSIVNNHVVMNVQEHHIHHQTPVQKHSLPVQNHHEIPLFAGVPPKGFHAKS